MNPVAVSVAVGFVGLPLVALAVVLGCSCCSGGGRQPGTAAEQQRSGSSDSAEASLDASLLGGGAGTKGGVSDSSTEDHRRLLERAASVAYWSAWQQYLLLEVNWVLISLLIFLAGCLSYLVSTTVVWGPWAIDDNDRLVYATYLGGATLFYIMPWVEMISCAAAVWHSDLDEAERLRTAAVPTDSGSAGQLADDLERTIAVRPAGGAQLAGDDSPELTLDPHTCRRVANKSSWRRVIGSWHALETFVFLCGSTCYLWAATVPYLHEDEDWCSTCSFVLQLWWWKCADPEELNAGYCNGNFWGATLFIIDGLVALKGWRVARLNEVRVHEYGTLFGRLPSV